MVMREIRAIGADLRISGEQGYYICRAANNMGIAAAYFIKFPIGDFRDTARKASSPFARQRHVVYFREFCEFNGAMRDTDVFGL